MSKPIVPDLSQQVTSGQVLPDAARRFIEVWNDSPPNSWQCSALEELVQEKQWTEINDRFYKALAFGTGGLRGRTIGRYITKAESGKLQALGCPEHACVGTNAMNDANVERAGRGFARYLKKSFPGQRPKIVLSHDTRHFSRHFAELVAHAAANEGVDAYLFPEERSTPQLSFTVRWLGAQGGAMLTASHNPPHDNGFKAYFADGGQLVEPHASHTIEEVNTVKATGDLTPRDGAQVRVLGPDADAAYLDALETLVLDRPAFDQAASSLKVVYTPIHGTGIRAVRPILERLGVAAEYVPEQTAPDGRFPTVKSPNPENGEALALGIKMAKERGADLVIATDPDCDRMGVALRNDQGEFELITGNQIGSIMAYHRISTFVRQGVITPANASRACIIKTFVTTELQDAIAKRFGLKTINTLTGFKYIGEKMLEYEKLLVAARPDLSNYNAVPTLQRRTAHLEAGCFYAFGGEESYGYSGGDYVRDKDGNAAVVMFVEAFAAAQAAGLSMLQYLDQIYAEFGFYAEYLGNIVLEGAEGAVKIQKMLASFQDQPPTEYLGNKITTVQNFARDEFRDTDGKVIPKELMLLFHLDNGTRIAVRGSGTEPKVKCYFFGCRLPAAGTKLSSDDLAKAKSEVRTYLQSLWKAMETDGLQRAG
jgi:phosphoglucomutase